MDKCVNQPGWKVYFKENMDDLGLASPACIFAWLGTSLTSINGYAGLVKTFGTRSRSDRSRH